MLENLTANDLVRLLALVLLQKKVLQNSSMGKSNVDDVNLLGRLSQCIIDALYEKEPEWKKVQPSKT